jgi:hypothetical protein
MGNEVRIHASVKDDASKPIGSIHDAWKRPKGYGIGVGAAVAAKGLNLVEGAAEGVVHGLEEIVHAGLEGEASQRRLETSLKANVAGWDGATEAIERHIHANLRLGFTDDEQRDSLTRLVAATHDIQKAYEVQQVAMDLARFKGISLGDATEALTKVEAGSYRVLKSLGIVLKDNATQTDALAAVEKVASNQAEDFANTTEGKLQAAQARLGDTMEHLGTKVLPLVAHGLEYLSQVIDPTSRSFDDFAASAKKDGGIAEIALITVQRRAAEVGVSAEVLYKKWQENGGDMDQAVRDLADGVTASAEEAAKAQKTWADSAIEDTARYSAAQRTASDAAHAMEVGVKGAAERAAAAFEKSAGRISVAISREKENAIAAAEAEVTGYFDVLVTQDNLAATNAEIAANRRIIASSKATAAEKRDARDALHSLYRDQFTYLEDLAKAGKSGTKEFKTAMADLLQPAQDGPRRRGRLAPHRNLAAQHPRGPRPARQGSPQGSDLQHKPQARPRLRSRRPLQRRGTADRRRERPRARHPRPRRDDHPQRQARRHRR